MSRRRRDGPAAGRPGMGLHAAGILTNAMIPRHLRPLFWDTDLSVFNPEAYPDYTIFRVLELGDEAAVVWLRETFPEMEICRVLSTEKRLSAKSATFWSIIYGIPSNRVAALRHSHKSQPEWLA